jgi:hypothetical protein
MWSKSFWLFQACEDPLDIGGTLRWLAMAGIACAMTCSVGCGDDSKGSSNAGSPTPAAQPAQPAIPAEIETAAQKALGSEAEVLVHGDLARNGKQQAVVVNPLHKAGLGPVSGSLITRLTVIEDDGGQWKEILLCDEHLKNPSGFLGGAPIAAIPAWRLQYDQDPQRGLLLFFIPYDPSPTAHPVTVQVRWNEKAKRYQTFTNENFIGETQSLEEIHRQLQ